ncbi:hypothetical protein HPB50_000571 [Hyalomma asiaticum]|uniref:Uncharacterized protein n=1 Tax=Hyalomma asiaticum TaxID=266040 RepID=A0ACB7T0V9_HYAAI|nr:hypothetical protein HPB50_000571 [Hyalomma asiaticum]
MRDAFQTLITATIWTVGAWAINTKSVPVQPEQKCFKELGCFKTGGRFYNMIYRPFNLFPEEREQIDTRFIFYSKDNAKRGELLMWSSTPKEVSRSTTFKARRPTKILVHGWIDTVFFAAWLTKMMHAFLTVGDYNVIIVDWQGGNSLPYAQATANTRVVGAEIALLVKKLEKAFGAKRNTFHIIGHSLGAHVAGYAGERLPGLGRITGDLMERTLTISGLDPADPYFQHMPKEVRLDATDARLVDVVHTDGASVFDIYRAEGLGMYQPAGHLDFYPNGGIKMPGCPTSSPVWTALTKGVVDAARTAVCNHERAVRFFLDTITERECTSLGLRLHLIQRVPQGPLHGLRLQRAPLRPNGNVRGRLEAGGQHFRADVPPHYGFGAILRPLRLYGAVKNKFVVKTRTYIGDLEGASFRYTSSQFFFFQTNMMLRHVEVLPMNEPLKT